jgi:DNA-binding transcriptional regulator GbsR (MarR family)
MDQCEALKEALLHEFNENVIKKYLGRKDEIDNLDELKDKISSSLSFDKRLELQNMLKQKISDLISQLENSKYYYEMNSKYLQSEIGEEKESIQKQTMDLIKN